MLLDLVFCDYVTQKHEEENCFLDLNGFLTHDAVSCPGHKCIVTNIFPLKKNYEKLKKNMSVMVL